MYITRRSLGPHGDAPQLKAMIVVYPNENKSIPAPTFKLLTNPINNNNPGHPAGTY
jgi:hypothetical protein